MLRVPSKKGGMNNLFFEKPILKAHKIRKYLYLMKAKDFPLGRWAFAEFCEVYQIESDFEKKVESAFNKMLEGAIKGK